MFWVVYIKAVLSVLVLGFGIVSVASYMNQRRRHFMNNDYRHCLFCTAIFVLRIIFSVDVHFKEDMFAMDVLSGLVAISIILDALALRTIKKMASTNKEYWYKTGHHDNMMYIYMTINLALTMFTVFTYTSDGSVNY